MALLFESVPHAVWLVAVGALSMVASLCAAVWAVSVLRRGRITKVTKDRAKWLLALAVLALATVPALTVWLAAAQRSLFRVALEHASLTAEPPRSGDLAQSLSGVLNTLPFGLALVWPAVLYPAMAAIVLLSKILWTPTQQIEASNTPVRWWAYVLGSAVWAQLGFSLPAATAAKYCADLIGSLSRIHELAPEAKESFMLVSAAEAYEPLLLRFLTVGLVMLVPLIAGLIIIIVADRDDDPSTTGAPVRLEWIIATACLVGAAGIFVASAPLRAENAIAVPINPISRSASPPSPVVVLPDLQAIATIQMSPVLQLDATRLWLDGRSIDDAGLTVDLGILRRNYGILYPDREFPGRLAVMCDVSTPSERLQQLFMLTHDAAYRDVQLIVGREYIVERPVLGKLKRDTFAAVDFKLVLPNEEIDAEDTELNIRDAGLSTCGQLARALIERQRVGKPIALRLAANVL